MDYTLYLVRLGEISLKGLNRDFFEGKLKTNIKTKLHPYHSRIAKQKGRLFVYVEDQAPDTLVREALSSSFGIVGFSKAIQCEKDFETIKSEAMRLVDETWKIDQVHSFKVETRRADKTFPMKSYDISAELGHLILERYHTISVDVHHPDRILYVEIRDSAYLYTDDESGPGGLPVGTAGRGMLMLSGGIDSPVAAYRMAKRGLRMEAVYFHAYPYTSQQAMDKVAALARILSRYCLRIVLHVVPFTDVQLHIKAHSRDEETTLLMRACMMQIATMIAAERDCSAIVTGESLSQVASQTLESIRFTDGMTDLPVFRPLIGMDKEEIITTARLIGTYETSILPYEDCCVIFSPKHPLVKPRLDSIRKSYELLGIERLLKEAVEKTERILCS